MQKDLQVYLPYEKSLISQRFGANANYSYAADGLKGHTSYDWDPKYGTQVSNCVIDGYCYSVLNRDNPDPSKYRAVYLLVETQNGLYEVSYGHFSGIFAKEGKTYQPGDILGLVGNTGTVFSGDHEVSKTERLNGSRAGAHLHGPQIRPVKRVVKKAVGKKYLANSKGTYKKDGFFFEVINYYNGFNGCISLAQFSTETLASQWKIEQTIKTTIPIIEKELAALPVEEPARAEKLTLIEKLLQSLGKLLGLY